MKARRIASATVLMIAVAFAGACSGSGARTSTGGGSSAGAAQSGPTPAPPPGTVSSPTGACTVTAKLVPTCGVLWGVATYKHDAAAVRSVEQQIGRPFDFVYRYYDIGGVLPTAEMRDEIDRRKTLHIALAARDFKSSSASDITYAAIAAGKYDSSLRKQGAGIASLHVPIFVTFEQEANQKDKVGVRGTPAEFKAAWRHVHDVYVKAGATNAVWVWVMTGSADNLAAAAKIWPGNDDVDWISWNVYNQANCQGGHVDSSQYVSFEDRMRVFYDWVHKDGPGLGIDASKPMMISETGSAQYPTDPKRTADWYAQIPATLQQYPQIKAVGLWDSYQSTACDYRFERNPTILAGVRAASQTPLVRQLSIPSTKLPTG